MPRSLISSWKRVAVSGTTTDNREITPQELREVAETYKPKFVTASIWCEHERDFGSFGTVYALRLVEDDPELEPDQVALEAQLRPNDKLLHLNDRGEKLFSSIEITPNFRGRGKCYLTGLAVTDEPASTYTQELYFSKRTHQTAYYAASVQLDSLRDQPEEKAELGLINALTSFFRRFAETPAATPPQPSQPESKPPMDEATSTALSALLEQLLIVAAGIQAVIEPATEDAPAPDQAPIDSVSEAVGDIVNTAEEQREFRRTRAGTQQLQASLGRIEKMFSHMMDTPTGRVAPRTRGPVTQPHKRVL